MIELNLRSVFGLDEVDWVSWNFNFFELKMAAAFLVDSTLEWLSFWNLGIGLDHF